MVQMRFRFGWSPTRTLHPFWGNFRVAVTPGTRTVGVSPFGLVDERIGGDYVLIGAAPASIDIELNPFPETNLGIGT
jgi:hypothetical protein